MQEKKSAKSYVKNVVKKKLLKSKLMKLKMSREELYKALCLGPETELQGADAVRFIELLISLTENRGVRFKIINRDEIYLKMVFQLKKSIAGEKFKKTDNWQIRVKKFTRPKKFFGKLLGMRNVYYLLWIRNKFNPYPERVGVWEVREDTKDLLAFRLGKLMEVVFRNLYRM